MTPVQKKAPGRIAEVFGLVAAGFRRVVDLVAALLLEIERRGEVGELEDVDVEAAGGALGRDLVVQRAGLGPDIARLDLREVLAERLGDRRRPGLVLMAVEDELALLLGLGDVGIGEEVENLGRGFRRRLGMGAARRKAGDRRSERDRRSEKRSAGELVSVGSGHGVSPKAAWR